ncbi:MAG: phage holin family protein [Deltaproteobacteria bacterium]
MRLLLHWLLSAVALLVMSAIVPGIEIRGFGTAMIAVVVLGLANGTIGLVLKVLTFPLTLLTLGLFWWVVNGLMLLLASSFVPGFQVAGLGSAFIGSIVLALINLAVHGLLRKRQVSPARR